MSDLAPVEPTGSVAIRGDEIGLRGMPPSLAIMLNESLYQRVKAIAAVMSRAAGFTPAHLVGKGEACFSVITMAMDWKLSWHFVARHTYQTPGGSIGYDGALVQSILEQSGKFIGAPAFEYRGDWSVLMGKFQMQSGRGGGQYPAATWTDKDAVGLGVIVRWTVRGESVPRVWPGENEPFWLTQCQPRNSPLWATDPKTQIRYLAIRRFANMTAPGILGGASFDRDELMEAADLARDITPEPNRADYGAGTVLTEPEPEPEFAVVDLDGVENLYATGEAAATALRLYMAEAQRLGVARLEGWWDGNDGALQLLVGAGFGDLAVDLTRAYDDLHKRASAPPSPSPTATGGGAGTGAPDPGPDPASDRGPAASPATGARRTRRAATPPDGKANPDKATGAPADATGGPVDDDDRFPGDLPAGQRLGLDPSHQAAAGNDDERQGGGDQGGGQAVDHRMPETEPPPTADAGSPANEDRRDLSGLAIPVPMGRNRQEDFRTWGIALLGPKVRRCTTSNQLADLLGANNDALDRARVPGAMGTAERDEMERIIAEQWAKLPT